MMEVNEVEIDARFAALVRQRDIAQAEAVNLAGVVAVQTATIERLSRESLDVEQAKLDLKMLISVIGKATTPPVFDGLTQQEMFVYSRLFPASSIAAAYRLDQEQEDAKLS